MILMSNINDTYVLRETPVFYIEAALKFGDGMYGDNPQEGLSMVVYYNVNDGAKSNTEAASGRILFL